MPPATATEVIEPHVTRTESAECKLRQNVKSATTKTEEDEATVSSEKDKESPCAYDVMLSRLPQPWFLKPVRAWEKRYGFVTPIRWTNTILITAFHLIVVGWVLKSLYFANYVKWQTVIFGEFLFLQ